MQLTQCSFDRNKLHCGQELLHDSGHGTGTRSAVDHGRAADIDAPLYKCHRCCSTVYASRARASMLLILCAAHTFSSGSVNEAKQPTCCLQRKAITETKRS